MAKKKTVSTNPAAQAPAASEPNVLGGSDQAKAASVAKAPSLVQVEYHKDNHHVLDGVHAIRKGLNHLPAHVWEKAKSHPSVAKLMKDGHLVDLSEPKEEDKAPVDADPSADDAGAEAGADGAQA